MKQFLKSCIYGAVVYQGCKYLNFTWTTSFFCSALFALLVNLAQQIALASLDNGTNIPSEFIHFKQKVENLTQF